MRPQPRIQPPPALPRTMPRQPIPGGGGGGFRPESRSIQKSISPQAPVTSIKGFTTQTTKAGSPIVQTSQGKRYAVPQKGISTSLRGNLLGSTSLKSGYINANVPQKIRDLSISKQLAALGTSWGPHSGRVGPLGDPNDPKSHASTLEVEYIGRRC